MHIFSDYLTELFFHEDSWINPVVDIESIKRLYGHNSTPAMGEKTKQTDYVNERC